MSEHYYTQKPSAAHNEGRIEVSALGLNLVFDTDAGVFAKSGFDYGSRLLIESLPELHGNVLDLGCGWGPIGVLLAKKYPDIEVLQSDINERAVALTKKNIALNRALNATAIQSDGYGHIEGAFDFIITNPPIRAGKQVIYSLFDGAKAHLKDGGALFIVIRKQHGAPSALKHLQEIYKVVEVIARDKGFWIIKASL